MNLRRDHLRLRDRVLAVVRDRIIEQHYRGGQQLTLDELARDLGVSATPVRDALAQLERDGLVRLNARGTAVVRRFTRKDLIEIFDLRLAIEPLAARLATPRLDARARAGLRQKLEAGRTALGAGSVGPALDADRAIHEVVIKACDNDRVAAVLKSLAGQVEVFRARGAWTSTAHRYMVYFDELLDAWERGDGAAAAVAMTGHLEVSRDEALSDYEQWRE